MDARYCSRSTSNDAMTFSDTRQRRYAFDHVIRPPFSGEWRNLTGVCANRGRIGLMCRSSWNHRGPDARTEWPVDVSYTLDIMGYEVGPPWGSQQGSRRFLFVGRDRANTTPPPPPSPAWRKQIPDSILLPRRFFATPEQSSSADQTHTAADARPSSPDARPRSALDSPLPRLSPN